MSTSPVLEGTVLGGRIEVHVGDLTAFDVDAIVNAANATLLGGGGVDGAIHRAGGPAILAACRAIRRERWPGGLPTGHAVATTGGDLPAREVIHTVGPIWREHPGDPQDLLGRCYTSCLALAAARGHRSIAFPAISTGVYGYPKDEAARRVLAALRRHEGPPERILLVFFTADAAAAFLAQGT
jgi:O-acetyl-ADP-ribose deacetylase (regulator of RNase III)